MARQLEFSGRRYWILSEPQGDGWTAKVVEVIDASGTCSESMGIDAAAETRAAADDAAERKLRRMVRARPSVESAD
jgi:hypothetical protein